MEWDLVNTCLVPEGRHQGQVVSLSQAAIDLSQPQPVSQSQPGSHSQVQMLLVDSRYTQNDARYPQLEAQAVTQGEMREEGYWSTEDGSMVASQEPLSVARATRALQHAQMQMSQYGHADAATSFLGSEQQQEQRQRQPLQQQRQLQLQQQLLQIQQQGRLQSQQQNLQLQQQGPLHLQQQLRQLRHQHMQVQLQLEEQRQHQQQSHQQRQQQQLRAELQQQQQRWPSTQQHEQQLQQPQQPRTSPSSATAETAATAATAVGREAPDAPLCDLSSRPDAGFQVGAAQEGGPTGGSSSKLGGSGSRSGSASGNCGGRNRSTSGDVSAAGAGSGGASGAGSGSSAGTRSGRVLSIREQLAQQLSRDMDMLIPGRLQRGGSSRAASTAGKSASPAGRSVAVADRSGDTAGTVADGPRPADAASPGTTAGTRADTAGSRGDTAGTAGTLGNMGSRMKASGHMASFGDSAPGLVNHVGAGDLPFLENSSNFNGFWATGGASGGGAMLDGPGQLDGSLLPLTYTGRQGDLADFILAESEQYAALRSSQGSAALVQAPSSVTQGQLPTMGTQAQAAPTVTQRQAPPRVTQAQALGQGGLARVGEEGRRKGGAGEAEQELAAIEAALLRDLKRRAAQIQVAGATLAQGRAMPTVTQGQAGGGQAMRTVTEKHAGRKTPPVVAQVQALPAAEAGTDAALLRNLDLPVARNQALRAKTLHDEAALMSRLEGQSVRNQAGQRPSVRGQAVESAAVQSQSVHGQAVRGQAARSGSGSLSCSGHSAEVGEGARRIPQAHQPASERAEAGLAGDLLDELARMLAQGEYITGPYNTVQSGAVNTSGQHSRVQLSAQNMDSWVEDAGGKGMVRRPGLVESERQQLLEVEALARLYQGGASDNGAGNGSVEFREGSGGAQPRAASELGQQQLYMHLEALARLGEGVGGSPGEEEGLPAPFINASLQSLPINPTVPHNSFANMSASNPASLSSPSAAGLSPEEIALLAEAKRQGLQPALSLHGMPEDQSEPWDLPLDCPGTAPVKPVAPPGALAYLGETPTEHLSNSRGTPGASAGGPPAIPGAATGTAGPASQLAIHSRILQHWDSHLGISSGALRSPEGPFSGTPGMHSVPGDKGARELGHIHLVREGHRDAGTSGSGHNSSSQGTTPVPPNRTLSGPHSESRHSTPQGCGASSLLGGPYSESVPPASLQTAQKEASAAGRSIGWTNGEAQWQQSTLGARDPGWHAGGVPLAAGTGGSRGADGVPLVGPGRGSLLEGRQAGREGDRLLDEVKAAPSQLGNQLAVMLQQLQGQAADQQARPLLLGAADVGGEAAVEGESGPEIASGGLKRSALLLGAVQGLDTDPSSTLAPYRDSTVSLAFSNAQGLAGFGAPGADMFPRPQLKRRIDTHQAAGFLRGEAGVGRGYKGGTPGYTAGAITLDPVPLLQPPRPPPAAPESRVMFLKQRLLLTARALESGNMGHFEHLFSQLKPMAKSRGDAIERLLTHCLHALELRRTSQGHSFFCTPLRRRLKDLTATQEWYHQSLPFSRFASTFFTSTILDALKDHKRVHVVNIGPMMHGQFPAIMRILSEQAGGPPALRITNVDTTTFVNPGRRDLKTLKGTSELAARMQKEAAALGLPSFEFHQVDLDEKGLHLLYCVKRAPHEGLVVVSALEMLHFPNEPCDHGASPRDYILQWIADLRPLAFGILDIDLDSTSPIFLKRFESCLDHHLAAFELDDAVTGPNEKRTVQIYEELIYGRTIANIVSCEGKERVVRPESLPQWQARLQQAGFQMKDLSPSAVSFAQGMLGALPRGFGLLVGQGTAVLTWQDVPRQFFMVLRPPPLLLTEGPP